MKSLDGVELAALAEQVATPFYAYSASRIRERIAALAEAFRGIDAMTCYAVKANSNLAILALIGAEGLGADIVSGGELERCLRAGIPASRIVFSGVGKTEAEISAALAAGVFKFNLESYDELLLLQKVACARRVPAQAAVRVNPDVDAGTHEKISTGKAENKFGVTIAEARRWFAQSAKFPNVRLNGLHVHIGSQILSVEPFKAAIARVGGFWRELMFAGHAIDTIDVGGGLGVVYRDEIDRPVPLADYVDAIRAGLAGYTGRLVLEPGRFLVAEAGVLMTRVLRVKPGETRDFLVLDAAMNDLVRPAMYGAWHDLVAVGEPRAPEARYDVVGPVCETGDTFAVDRALPPLASGDLVAILDAGAYGSVMSSTYNSRPLIAELLLDRGRYAVIRRAQSFEQMIENEVLPQAWLGAAGQRVA